MDLRILALALLTTGTAHAASLNQDAPAFLPAYQAFVPEHCPEAGHHTIAWRIEPGYYLYRHALSFTVDGDPLNASIPDGEPYLDEHFGEVTIYRDQLFVQIPATEGVLTVTYQGCADAGLCYPPQEQRFELVAP